PKKYRQEALDMIKEGCHGCLDNLISTLPKVSDYAKDGTVFGIPPNTANAPSSTTQSPQYKWSDAPINTTPLAVPSAYTTTQGGSDSGSAYINPIQEQLRLANLYRTNNFDSKYEQELRSNYGVSPHEVLYKYDPIYAQKIDNDAKLNPHKILYPPTDLRRGNNIAPNTEWMYPNLTGQTQSGQTQWANEDIAFNVIGSGMAGQYFKGAKTIDDIIDVNKGINTIDDYVKAKTNRMLAQKNKFSKINTEGTESALNIYKNFDNRFSVEPARVYGKVPENLGVNSNGKAVLFEDAISKSTLDKLTPLQQKYIAAHEVDHFYRNDFDEATEWLSHFDNSKLSRYMRGKCRISNDIIPEIKNISSNNGLDEVIDLNSRFNISQENTVPNADEIRARAGQLKEYIAIKNNLPLNKDFTVTSNMLDDAIKNYTKDVGLDNSMSELFNALKDKKGFLKSMNSKPLIVVPAIGTAGAIGVSKNSNNAKKNNNN
ncbi:MAG TPA: hypothetical protein PK891_04570, partial [Bacteroidales bacterium]|nr:hypothetical protein [Bacteroidales bacterium]